MLGKLIKLLGGYTKDEVLTEVVKHLYNTIGPDDILSEEKKGTWMMGGKSLTEQEMKQLIAEAQVFTNTRLWKALQLDIKYKSNQKMFERSQSDMDLIAGKLWLYTLDSIKTRLESLSKGKGTFNSDAR